MEDFKNTPVKDLISKNPKISGILNDFGIGCVSCALGSCLFKDIVGIHDLQADKEAELLYSMETILHPDRKIEKPDFSKIPKREKEAGGPKYSPPIKMLADEHVKIKKLLALIPGILKDLDIKKDKDMKLIAQSLNFITNYADKFHHAKEEDILFDYADKNMPVTSVMLKDHALGRSYVKGAREALKKKDNGKLMENLLAYKDLLDGHIDKEDLVLYPWIDRQLSTAQVGELYSKFASANKNADQKILNECLGFINGLKIGRGTQPHAPVHINAQVGAPHEAPSGNVIKNINQYRMEKNNGF
ncbi:MAG: hemerythrin domain-containing protein [Candidatus Margulisiibacteriota bacterium]